MCQVDSDFRAVVDHSVDAVIIGRPTGEILYANPAAARLFGTTPEELCRIGRQGITDVDLPVWRDMTEERRRSGRVRGVAPMRRVGGAALLAEVSSALFVTPEGEELSSTIVRDVTGSVRRERNLAAYNEVVEALLKGADANTVLGLVARHARIIFDGTDATVVTPADPPDDVMVTAADGPTIRWLLGRRYPAGSLARRVMNQRQPFLVEDAQAYPAINESERPEWGSAMVAPIVTGDDVYGALFVGVNTTGRPYNSEDLGLMADFAQRAALALAVGEARARSEQQERRLNRQLQEALQSRIVIEQAKGVVSVTRRVTTEDAFQRIRAYARSHNQDVHTVARSVVERNLLI